MLDIERLTCVNALPEVPTVILATNQGNNPVRGTKDIVVPRGIPIDLVERGASNCCPAWSPSHHFELSDREDGWLCARASCQGRST